jgi:hypothetical protein
MPHEFRTHTTIGITIPVTIDADKLVSNLNRLAQVLTCLVTPDLALSVFVLPLVKGLREQTLVELHNLSDVLLADFQNNK